MDCFLDDRTTQETVNSSTIIYKKTIMFALLPFIIIFLSYVAWKLINIFKKMDIEKLNSRVVSSVIIVLFLSHPNIVS